MKRVPKTTIRSQYFWLLFSVLILILFGSCEEQNISSPKLDNLTPGQIHNEVLERIAQTVPLNRHSMKHEEFTRVLLSSLNRVLESHGATKRVTEADLRPFAGGLLEIERATGYDFSDPANDYSKLEEAVLFLVGKGCWSRESAIRFLENSRAVAGGKGADLSPTKTQVDAIADDMLLCSFDFWSATTDTVPPDDPGDDKNDRWTDGLLTTDAIGAILGAFLGGPYGCIIGGLLASLAFVHADDLDDWWLD
jgi:hypothetical protein